MYDFINICLFIPYAVVYLDINQIFIFINYSTMKYFYNKTFLYFRSFYLDSCLKVDMNVFKTWETYLQMFS